MTTFDRLWDDLAEVGRDPHSGGSRRFAWTDADLTLREWCAGACAARGLDLVEDRFGNQRAGWGDPDHEPGIVTGSHLDSVPDGGAYDGPRVITGAMTAERALGLTDGDGVTMAAALRRAGRRLEDVGRDDDRRDAMLACAEVIVAARAAAVGYDCHVTVEKLTVHPGGVNAIPSAVTAWLDARGADGERVQAAVSELSAAMIFVRNLTGVSHSPAECDERDDCLAGVEAPTTVLRDLAGAA